MGAGAFCSRHPATARAVPFLTLFRHTLRQCSATRSSCTSFCSTTTGRPAQRCWRQSSAARPCGRCSDGRKARSFESLCATHRPWCSSRCASSSVRGERRPSRSLASRCRQSHRPHLAHPSHPRPLTPGTGIPLLYFVLCLGLHVRVRYIKYVGWECLGGGGGVESTTTQPRPTACSELTRAWLSTCRCGSNLVVRRGQVRAVARHGSRPILDPELD